ncbi:glycosyltransferase family 2 protein [Leuconostoc mesenteroides]|nr:glycosyltransferase family 2 protein [Leuconostoc mesenteroides]
MLRQGVENIKYVRRWRIMQNKIKYSIIMPVYNVADFVVEAIDSILKQSYKNFELILVNDGSTDDSYEIISSLATTDERLYVINKSNGGLSDARNEGLSYVSGDYIFFMDSDDTVNSNMLDIVNQQIQRDTKALMIGYQYLNDKGTSVGKTINPGIYTGEQIMQNILLGKLENYVWQFIVHKSILSENLLFKKGLLFEDIDWTPRLLSNLDYINYVGHPLYFYRTRSDSIVHTKSLKKIKDLSLALTLMQNTVQHNFPKQLKYIDIWRQPLDLTIYYNYSFFGWENSSDKIRLRRKIKKFKNEGLSNKQIIKKYLIGYRVIDTMSLFMLCIKKKR